MKFSNFLKKESHENKSVNSEPNKANLKRRENRPIYLKKKEEQHYDRQNDLDGIYYLDVNVETSEEVNSAKVVQLSSVHVDGKYTNDNKVCKEADRGAQLFSKTKKEIEKPKVSKDIVYLVVENLDDAINYKDKILGIVGKILHSSSECLFSFIEIGKTCASFEMLPASEAQNIILNKLFSDDGTEEKGLLDTFLVINEQMSNLKTACYIKEEEKRKIYVKQINLLYIGGFSVSKIDEEKIAKIMLSFKNEYSNKIRTKCLCLKDLQCTGAASCGFEVIGHIEQNYYS